MCAPVKSLLPSHRERVQQRLAEMRSGYHATAAGSEALLMGRIFDDRGNRMSPSHSRKGGARYELLCVRRPDPGTAAIRRVGATFITTALENGPQLESCAKSPPAIAIPAPPRATILKGRRRSSRPTDLSFARLRARRFNFVASPESPMLVAHHTIFWEIRA
jgi:hypothetical protein